MCAMLCGVVWCCLVCASGGAVLVCGVADANAKRETGRKAQLGNIAAAKSVADVIRTTLGPRSMLKMILDPMGGIVMTNDGNAILREIDVSHPAAKSMIELSRTQDEEVGDGTTSVIILAGELLTVAQPFIEQRNLHPRLIVGAYVRALDSALAVLQRSCLSLDPSNRPAMLSLVRSVWARSSSAASATSICNLALDAVMKVTVDTEGVTADGRKKKEIDIKRYARVEKIPGGYLEDSCVLDGVMLNKDVVHPAMKRRIVNPRIILLDCNLEYKKAESQTNLELKKEEDFEAVLRMEEEYIDKVCQALIRLKPDLICVEKGVSDLAAHYLQKAGISVLRRLSKTDNNRIARATGAVICSVPEEVKEVDVGKGCGLFEVQKVGDEYFSYLIQCKDPEGLHCAAEGASKDVLNEIERNLLDAMAVVRNLVFDPALSQAVGSGDGHRGRSDEGGERDRRGQSMAFQAVATALEIIPKTLIDNCGGSAIRLLTALRAKHAAWEGEGMCTWGIDGNKGEVVDMVTLEVYEPFAVKSQTIKTAIEAACMLLRIDDIVSGMTNKQGGGGAEGEGHSQVRDRTRKRSEMPGTGKRCTAETTERERAERSLERAHVHKSTQPHCACGAYIVPSLSFSLALHSRFIPILTCATRWKQHIQQHH